MSNAPANHDSSPQDIERNDVLNAIGSKWGKFSNQELSALKTNDALVSQVVRTEWKRVPRKVLTH